ncbi:MAG: MFS transporter, partial [Pseudomonadota bacterium]
SRASVFENMTRSLDLSDEVASLFFVVPSLCAFLSSMAIERFLDRLSSVFILRLGLVCMGAAFTLFGLTGQFSLILVEAVLFGVGFGLVSVAQNVAVSESSDSPDLQRSLFAGLHSMYALASLMSPLLAGFLFRLQLNWSEIFLVCAVLPACVLGATSLLNFEKPSETQSAKTSDVGPSHKSQDLEVFPLKHALFFSVAMSVYLIAEISVSSRLVVYVRRELSISDELATRYLAAFFLFLFLGRLGFVFFNFAKVQTHKLMYVSLLGACVLYTVGLVVTPWLMSLSGLFMAPFFPLVMDYAVRVFHRFSSRVIAFCMAFASLSVVFMHYGLGAMSDRVGLASALWVGPAALVICLSMFLIERRLYHRV